MLEVDAALEAGKLWPVQVNAIQSLEKSLADNRPRSLIQMTMGSGKTFTAVSQCYFEQMKGRGSRVISSDDLLSVTPDAKHKTRFVIVDAVGVCERDKTCSKPLGCLD